MAFGQEGFNQENVGGFKAQAGGIHSDNSPNSVSDFMLKVYGWMGFGLFITGFVSFALSMSETLLSLILGPQFYVLLIGELILVGYLSARIFKMSANTAGALFFAYSVMNGLTLTPLFLMYTGESLASTFVICAGTFGATAMYGYATKKDLSGMGSYLMMGLIGIIIASLVNIVLGSPAIYWAVTFGGVLLFVALTAYDTQQIKAMASGVLGDEQLAEKASILGALKLYLDFINLFIFLLRIFGDRRR